MSNSVQTNAGELILDSHKLSYHYDRVQAWEAGERVAPVSVDMSLTRACSAMCSFCYAMMQESQARSSIKTSHALNLLDDFAFLGAVAILAFDSSLGQERQELFGFHLLQGLVEPLEKALDKRLLTR